MNITKRINVGLTKIKRFNKSSSNCKSFTHKIHCFAEKDQLASKFEPKVKLTFFVFQNMCMGIFGDMYVFCWIKAPGCQFFSAEVVG